MPLKNIKFDFNKMMDEAAQLVNNFMEEHEFIFGEGWRVKAKTETPVQEFDRRTAQGGKLNLVTGEWSK
jgi:hypothetical protein